MPNGLFTPELIIEVAEAAEDSIITINEFSSIMGVITSVFMGVAVAGFVIILIRGVTKEFTKETGIKMKKVGGVLIPIME